MTETNEHRRMAENEVVFREYNEQVQKRLDDLRNLAKEEGQEEFISEDDTPLQFYCECSNEQCRERITLHPSRYNEIHTRRDRFIICTGHEVASIEKIIDTYPEYAVVEKFELPPDPPTTLHKTSVNT